MTAPEGKLKAGRRPNRRGEASRRHVLDVALRLLASGGPETVSVKLIAKEADVTWGTVQYQFGDADGFWAATILHILDTAGPDIWGRPSAGSVETRVAEVIDLLWNAFDSPYNAVVTNLRSALAKDRIELEGTISAPPKHSMRWKTTGSRSFASSSMASPSTRVTRAKSVRCCPQRFGGCTPSSLSGRTSMSMTPSKAFARRSPSTCAEPAQELGEVPTPEARPPGPHLGRRLTLDSHRATAGRRAADDSPLYGVLYAPR